MSSTNSETKSTKSDENNNDNNLEELLPIEQSIDLSEEIFFKLLSDNNLSAALDSLEPNVNKSLYHQLFKTCLLIFMAASTFDKNDIEKASIAVENLTKMSNRFRRTGIMLSLMKMIRTPNYHKYSDLELHAELIHTFCIAMSGSILAINTYNTYGLVKVVYRAQKFISKFQTCKIINKLNIKWQSESSQMAFESSVRLINGLCHLAISNIPPKLLKIVNFLGYKGIESVGFTQINKVAFQLSGMYSQYARMILLSYWLYAEPHGCLGPVNLEIAQEVLEKELKTFPKSVIFLGALAKFEQINGRINIAIDKYNYLLNEIKIKTPVYLELMFCYALKSQWSQCIKYAELVREDSNHSPALATYGEGVFKYVKSIETCDEDLKQKANELFEMVPRLRIRHLGKTITPEKVAVVNSEKYFKSGHLLILPQMEILYHGNYLQFIKGVGDLLNKLMLGVNKQVDHFKNDEIDSDYLDNLLVSLFYKGVLLKLMPNLSEAKLCFEKIIVNEPRIGREYSIVPQAVLELGLIEMELGNKEEAEKLFNKVISDFSGYLTENIVLVRAFAGLRYLGINTDKQREDEMKKNEYTKEWLKDLNLDQENYESLIVEDDKSIN